MVIGDIGKPKGNTGFASMDPEKRREIASKGGRTAHQKGRAHKWTADEARSASRKAHKNDEERKLRADSSARQAELGK